MTLQSAVPLRLLYHKQASQASIYAKLQGLAIIEGPLNRDPH